MSAPQPFGSAPQNGRRSSRTQIASLDAIAVSVVGTDANDDTPTTATALEEFHSVNGNGEHGDMEASVAMLAAEIEEEVGDTGADEMVDVGDALDTMESDGEVLQMFSYTLNGRVATEAVAPCRPIPDADNRLKLDPLVGFELPNDFEWKSGTSGQL